MLDGSEWADADEQAQAKDDPDYVGSEGDVSRSEGDVSGEDRETGKGRGSKRGRSKRDSKAKDGAEKVDKKIRLLVVEEKLGKEPLAGRLTPVLNRRE